MRLIPSATAALLAFLFTTGCVTRPLKGEYRDFRYESHPNQPHIGEIAVVFAEDSAVYPPIQWQIFATDFESGWRNVRVWSAPKFRYHFDGAYGIEFRHRPGGKNVVGCDDAPLESRMLRVRDQQRLTVPVAFTYHDGAKTRRRTR